MAAGIDLVEKTLEDLEREITCAVCQEHYTDPKILPCLHCYCEQCIHTLALRAGQGRPFPCPECRKNTVLPEGGKEELKSAFILNRLKSMYLKHKKALSKQVSCEICNKPDAFPKFFCRQCDKFACENCAHMHAVMTGLFNGHECVPVEQLQNIKSDKLVPKPPEPKKCSTHGEQLKIFCFDCERLICRDCTMKDHRDHNIEFNNVAADNKKKDLVEALIPLKEIEQVLSEGLVKVIKTEKEILEQEEAMTYKIEISFEELKNILERHKERLLKEVNKIAMDKIENLTVQKKQLSTTREEVRSVIDHTEQCMRLCSDEEIMSMLSDVTSRIKAQIEECHGRETDMEISEKADIIVDVDCAEALQQFCLENVWTGRSLKKIIEVPKTIEIGKEISFKVLNIESEEKVYVKGLKCLVQCTFSGDVFAEKIEAIKSGPSINYMLTRRGYYVFQISAYDHPVPGSPFTVTTYQNPTQFNTPMQVWNNVLKPYSIAINSRGEILIIEFMKAAIVLYNNIGEIERTVKQPHLCRLAIDNEDNVYIIGYGVNKLAKFDRNFSNVLVREVQGRGHYDIAVVGDEVLVTEKENKGEIVLYDKDLNFVCCISIGNEIQLRYLCPDSQGNLYVSTGAGSIVVLNENGDIVHSFSQDQNGVQILKDPAYVHVYGHYVYVADHALKKIVVFTTEGEYITTFGRYGPVCVDEQGIVYNCDYYYNCVYIY